MLLYLKRYVTWDKIFDLYGAQMGDSMRSRFLSCFLRRPGFLEGKKDDEDEGLWALLISSFQRAAPLSSILYSVIPCRIFFKPKISLLKYNLETTSQGYL